MKGRKTILFVVEVAVFSALALAFDFFCGLYGFAWLNGGSISIAMLPIFIMCYRHGLKGGLLCGLLVGSIQLLWADGFVHPVQAIIDYPAAYLVTGFAGIFFNQVKKLKRNSVLMSLGSCMFALGVLTPVLMLLSRTGEDNQEFETKKRIREDLIKKGIIA